MQKLTDETLIRKNNMKIFPWYKMLSWDLLFFYSISFLFLVDIKGLTPAQVILVDAFYPLFKFILQPFCTIIVKKIGKRNSLIFANSMVNVYLFDGITSLFTGFTYVINPYLPIIISLLINIIATILSYRLCEIPKTSTEKLKSKSTTSISQSFKDFFKDFKYGFRYVLKSDRLRSLITIYSLFYGILALTLTLRRSLLKELDVSAEYFGIIFAVMGIIAAISANRQNWFNKKFKNRTLTVLIVPYCVSCILLGFVAIFKTDPKSLFTTVMLIFALQYIIRGPFHTIIKRYLNNFSTTKARNKIYSITTFFESLVASLIAVIGSIIVEYSNSAYAFMVIGIISTACVLLLLKYMKTRVGLKPEEYKRSEIEMLNLK